MDAAAWIWPPAAPFAADDQEDPEGADLTWAYRWPAGEALAAALPDLVACAGRRVADLGCGRGRLGAAALRAGAAAVAFCDGSASALAQVAAMLAANHAEARATCHRHRWGEPPPGGPYDLILGGDLLYRPTFVPPLLASVAQGLAADGCALLSDPRRGADPELLAAAAALDLAADWRHDAAGGWSLLTLRRREAPSHAAKAP